MKKIIGITIGIFVVILGIRSYHFYTTDAQIVPITVVSPSILFVGDVMLGRNVEVLMNKNGSEFPFAHIALLLNSVDTVIANLEGPVVQNHIQTPLQSLNFTFDRKIPQILKSHNISLVTLANNHTFDQGAQGYRQSTIYLDNAGVDYFGHPYDIDQKYIVKKKIDGKKFIFVGFNITNPKFDIDKAHALIKSIPHELDEFLIVFNHGGDEYSLTSNKLQQSFYRGLIDDGVDLVIAAHPHVTQEIEIYKNKAIFYSVGNFIFDQYFSNDVQQALTIKMSFINDKVHYELIPIKSVHSQPEVMNGPEKITFLEALAMHSPTVPLNAIKKAYIEL